MALSTQPETKCPPIIGEKLSQVRVSVCMITYNHERFIAEALDSVLMQRTSFEYEIVIGVDCSADNTKDIVEEYTVRYPGKIKPNYYEERVGLKTNFVETLGRCQGEYVAVLSGDDYWIDPSKLQRQFDFLEGHTDHVLIGHNALALQEGESLDTAESAKPDYCPLDPLPRDLLVGNPYVASMVMFRNIIKEFPEPYFVTAIEDRPLYFLLSQYGRCRFEPDALGVYRKHSVSISGSRTLNDSFNARRELILNAIAWNEYFGHKYNVEVSQILSQQSRKLIEMSVRLKKYGSAIYYARFIDHSLPRSCWGRLRRRGIKLFANLLNYLVPLERWK